MGACHGAMVIAALYTCTHRPRKLSDRVCPCICVGSIWRPIESWTLRLMVWTLDTRESAARAVCRAVLYPLRYFQTPTVILEMYISLRRLETPPLTSQIENHSGLRESIA